MLENPVNRRSFLGGAATFAACAMMPRDILGADADKPNSVFNGVRIGINTYSYRGEIFTAEDTLKALVEDGLSEVELKEGPIQSFTGLSGVGPKTPKLSDAQREAILAKCAELRKMYNDAGVNIHVHKIPFGPTDEAIDLNFQIAKALGCMGITLERSEAMAKKLAPFAEKHKIWIGFHNHTDNYPTLDKDRPDPGDQPVHRLQLRHRALLRRHQGEVADPRDREVPRPHRQPAPEGPDRRRREPAVGHGADADQGGAAADEEGEVDLPRRHRARIQDPGGLDRRGRGGQVRPVLQGGARLRSGSDAATPSNQPRLLPAALPAPRHRLPVVRFAGTDRGITSAAAA